MKHWAIFAGIALLGLVVIVKAERDKVDVAPSPDAILYFVADTERELTRMPMHLTRMSDEEEIAVGNDLANNYQYISRPTPQDHEIEKYIQKVGARLAQQAHRKLPYKFHYIPDSSFINAFAIPGGHVYVGGGLLRLMDSEDELAAVMGHEIEHIDHYHCAERIQQERALRKIPMGELIGLPIEVFEAGYTKDQELEADREGTQLAVEAGYSSTGAIRVFEALQKLYKEHETRAENPGDELTHLAWQTLQGYFRSHPQPAERIARLKQLSAERHWEAREERPLAVKEILAERNRKPTTDTP